MNEKNKSRLGRGLDALLGNKDSDKGELQNINLERIEPNPYQPRDDIGEEKLKELAQSIEKNGVLQPIILTPVDEGFYLVAGERRWRAAKMAGLERIPAIIKNIDKDQMMELALIENIHRQDLNPLEEANAYKQLLDEFELTQAELATRLGRSRSSISNSLRLLHLAPEVREFVSRETLSAGQARAIAGLNSDDKQLKAAEEIIEKDMNVREAEKYIAELKSEQSKGEDGKEEDVLEELDRISEELEKAEEKEGAEQEQLLSELAEGALNDGRGKRLKNLQKELEDILQAPLKLESKGDTWQLKIELNGVEQLKKLINRLEE